MFLFDVSVFEGSADRTRGGAGGSDGSEVTSGLGCLFGLEKGGCGRSARRAGERRCLWRSAEADRIRWLPSPLPCTGLKTTSNANHERSKSQQY
ncbi:hypothetical protein R6Z07F_007089 [Ovis aries]